MVLPLSCSPVLSWATQLPAFSSSASASPSFPKLWPFSMFRILRSVPDPRTGRIFLIRIHLSETNSDRSSELSAHQISLGSSLGLFLRAERSSNLCPNSPRTKSSELSAHQTPARRSSGTLNPNCLPNYQYVSSTGAFYDHFGIFGPNRRIGFIRSGLHTTGLVQSGSAPARQPWSFLRG